MARTHFNVAPRYTAGSPGQVDEATARIVATQEYRAFNRDLGGYGGVPYQQRAKLLGLEGIVYSVQHVRGGVAVHDLITETHYRVPDRWWSATGEDRRTAYWYARTDRAQFLVGEGGTTPYEQRGKLYEAVVTCRYCCNLDHARPTCHRCGKTGTETRLLRKGA